MANSPLPASSDTILSVPYHRPPVYFDRVESVAGNKITVSGDPSWNEHRFADPDRPETQLYFVALRSGANEGRIFTITANGPRNLTVVTSGENDLSEYSPGDLVTIIPYWTLGSLLPPDAVAFPGSQGENPPIDNLRILLLPRQINTLDPTPFTSFRYADGEWKSLDDLEEEGRDDLPIAPGSYFIIRNLGEDAIFKSAGAVVTHELVSFLITATDHPVENPVAPMRPDRVTLADSGLIESGAFLASASAVQITDALVVYDNAVPGIDRPAVALFYYFNNGWRQFGRPASEDYGNEVVFNHGKAAFIRKVPTGNGNAVRWSYTPPYDL